MGWPLLEPAYGVGGVCPTGIIHALLTSGTQAEPLAGAPAELIDAVLLRVFARIDEDLPQLAPVLFAGPPSARTMHEMHECDGIEFSQREPAINVHAHGRGGEFAPRQNHQALTVRMPLSPPSAFSRAPLPEISLDFLPCNRHCNQAKLLARIKAGL